MSVVRALTFSGKRDFPSRVIVISPHADDAAFSVASTLKTLVSAGSAVTIINCFTLTRYAPFAVANDRISVVTRRRHEEERFLHHLGGDSQSDDLGLADAPARTGQGLRSILARYASPQDVFETVALLGENLEEAGDDTAVLAPLAIGDHSDHSIARQAAIAKYHDWPIAFYEDLPYAAAVPDDRVNSAVREAARLLDEGLHPRLIHWPGDSEWKRQCCSHYKSQISEAGIQKIVDYTNKNQGERLWCSARFTDQWKWRSTRRLPVVWQEPYFV